MFNFSSVLEAFDKNCEANNTNKFLSLSESLKRIPNYKKLNFN